MKAASPLLGFNNNVRHKGRVFHIQTEDSGAKHPHVITHLFADGGRILKTTKTSYSEHVGSERMSEIVRGLMKEQHKAMFIALRDGEFDRLFGDVPSQPGAPPNLEGPRGPLPSTTELPGPEETAAALALLQPTDKAPEAPKPAAPSDAAKPAALHAPAQRAVSPTAATVALAAPIAPPDAPGREPSPSEVDLDLDALERAAAEAQTPYFKKVDDLPPPPASVLGKKRPSDGPAGSYRGITPPQATPKAVATQAAERKAPAPASARYAPSRPAAIFAQSRPNEGVSIFGEDLISEKSLDEVILSYLAEDLEPAPTTKK